MKGITTYFINKGMAKVVSAASPTTPTARAGRKEAKMFSLGMQFGFGFMAAVLIVFAVDSLWDWAKKHYEIKKKNKGSHGEDKRHLHRRQNV